MPILTDDVSARETERLRLEPIRESHLDDYLTVFTDDAVAEWYAGRPTRGEAQADVARLAMPVLLVFADNDSVPQKHVAEFFALLGGGVKEPGWLNTRLSKSRLAVVPGYSHYNFITSAEVPQIIGKFLADPLTKAPAGAAAASQVAPPPEKKQQAWIRNRRGSVRLSSMGSSARTGRCSTPCMSGPGKTILMAHS